MVIEKGKREKIKIYSRWGDTFRSTNQRKAMQLIEIGLAEKYNHYSDGEFAIRLIKCTPEEAFRELKKQKKDITKIVCWECGKEPETNVYGRRNWCKKCHEKHTKTKQVNLDKYMLLRMKLMHDRALRIIENQRFPVDLLDYKEASKVVFDRAIKDLQVFDSAHEMVAVMELLRNKIMTKLKVRIGNHKPDILLPDEKIVLEIDGFLHKHRKKADKVRDVEMRKELGCEWEVVRIPTEYIEMNIKKLVDAIRGLKKEMQRVRKEYNGLLPENFSPRDQLVWDKLRRKLAK